MSKYRKVDTKIWNDEGFISLSKEGKLLFFMLLTHPGMTALGAMRATKPGLACELNLHQKDFLKVFREVSRKVKVEYDEKASFLWLPNFLKYNKPESPNVVRSWETALYYLPECKLKIELIQHVKAFVEALPEGFNKALPDIFRKSIANQRTENREYIHTTKSIQGDKKGENSGEYEIPKNTKKEIEALTSGINKLP